MLELAASAENITEQPPKLSTDNSGREVKNPVLQFIRNHLAAFPGQLLQKCSSFATPGIWCPSRGQLSWETPM
jgi:hypothetical protein